MSAALTDFTRGEALRLPELAEFQELSSDRFEVLTVLRGGMGVCAKIRHADSGAVYCLKTVQRELIADNDAYVRLLKELRLWLTVSACDGVVEAYCASRVNEIPCIAAAWMEGGSLRERIASPDPEFFVHTVDRLISTLAWVYSQHGVIHRDLKPENILFDSAGLAYVADWGLARSLSQPDHGSSPISAGNATSPRQRLTAAGEFLGTIFYASPEQISGRPDIDHRSDIYSLGCVLYEWEAGAPPFLGRTAAEIAAQHLRRPAPTLGGVLRRTKFGIEKLIARCLEKNPERRFQNYDELRQALHRAAQARGIALTPYAARLRRRPVCVGDGEFVTRMKRRELASPAAPGRGWMDADEVQPFIREASDLMALGRWQQACDILARLFVPELTQSIPDNPIVQAPAVNYGLCLINVGRPDDAVRVLELLRPAAQKLAEYYANLSLAYLHVGNVERAEHVAREGAHRFPADKDIMGNLLIAQTRQLRYTDAMRTAEQRLKLGRDVRSLEEVATLLCIVGGEKAERALPEAAAYFKRAKTLLEEAKSLNPRMATVRCNLAQTMFDLERFHDALDELQELARMGAHPSLGEPWALLMANCLDRLGRHEKCVDLCDLWIPRLPSCVAIRRIRAETIADGFCIGMMADSKPVFDRTSYEFFFEIVNDPKQRVATDYTYLARFHEWLGEVGGALALLQEAASIWPTVWEIPFTRATFEWRQGQHDAAIASATEAAHLAPWRPQPWRVLASSLEVLGRVADAREALAKAASIEQERKSLLSGGL
jgi:tetratricopeptide (TPR) repeat protein